jgi:hypothetical protein
MAVVDSPMIYTAQWEVTGGSIKVVLNYDGSLKAEFEQADRQRLTPDSACFCYTHS